MNLRIVFLFSITLSFASNYSLAQIQRIQPLLNELEDLKKIFERSYYWEHNYQDDLKLYTATVVDYTGTCSKSILECFYKEFEVLLEEISLFGEKDITKNFSHTLQNMQSYNLLVNKVPNTCKKCEEYEEKPVREFLNSFTSIAQKIVAQKKP